MKRTERLVAADEAEVFVREWPANGPPILFWHALGLHTSLQMIEAGPILARDYGYRVVGVDAPGFGSSPPIADERYEAPGLVALSASLLDALGLDRVAWAGSSWGGIVGVHFTAAHPERVAALVLIDGGYLDPINENGDTLEELRAYWREQEGFRFPSWDAALADARPWLARWTPEIEEYVRSAFRELNGEIVAAPTPDTYAAAMHGIDRTPPSSVHARLGETSVPVLLLVLRHRWAERFAADVPQADVRRIESAPHLMLEARPVETAREIGIWLQSLQYG